MRVYLPSTLEEVARAVGSGALTAPSGVGYAVTPSLREWYAEGDLEELEYVALTHAARASLRLLSNGSASPRRVVLAVDVDDGRAVPDAGIDVAAVRVDGELALDSVVSAHVDDPEVASDVQAALAALPAADAGDGDAHFVIESLEDHELQWFAAQEIQSLLPK